MHEQLSFLLQRNISLKNKGVLLNHFPSSGIRDSLPNDVRFTKALSVYIINLDHRKDRLENVLKSSTFLRSHPDLTWRLRGFKLSSVPWIGNLLSHCAALYHCLHENKGCFSGSDAVLVLEDDAYFVDPRNCTLLLSEVLGNVKFHWDVVQLAYTFPQRHKVSIDEAEKIGLRRVGLVRAGSALLLHKNFVPTLLDVFLNCVLRMIELAESSEMVSFSVDEFDKRPKNQTLSRASTRYKADVCWDNLVATHMWFVPIDRMVKQAVGYSDMELHNVDYSRFEAIPWEPQEAPKPKPLPTATTSKGA